MRDDNRYAQMLARVTVERQGRPLTLRLVEIDDPHNPYVVAKRLAVQGLAVFPVRGRRPLTGAGVYDATCDLNILCRMNWGEADSCGLATGEVNDVDVLDIDVRPPGVRGESPDGGEGKDGFAALAQLGLALPETMTAQTPRGGRHFFLHHVSGSGNPKLAADGSIEWFSDRKLVVVPPAPGRTWLNRAEIAQAPDWLRVLVLAPCVPPKTDDGLGGLSSGPLVAGVTDREVPRNVYFLILSGMPKAERLAQRRVRGLWRNLAAKQQGRNAGLFYTSLEFMKFVAVDELDRQVAAKLLWLACAVNGYLAKDKDSAAKAKEVIRRVLAGRRTVL
jgi:hypothetical protein